MIPTSELSSMIKHLKNYMEPGNRPSKQFNLLEHNQSQSNHFSSVVLPNAEFRAQLHSLSLSPYTSSLSNNHSHLDQHQDHDYNHGHQQSITDERSIRRRLSNRESARRSRMRKKKQIEELQVQVEQLGSLNHHLSEKVITLLESNHQILQENAELKEKVSSLHILMADMLFPRTSVEDHMNHIRAETPTRSNNHLVNEYGK